MTYWAPNPRQRFYRRHWSCLVGKVLISILGVTVVVGVCMVVDLRTVPWLPAFVLIPMGWLVASVVWWHSTYLCLESDRLVFRNGPFDRPGQYINYRFVDWTFDQRGLWEKLWNLGTLRVGHHTFEGYWPFRQLAAALRSFPAPAAAPPQPTMPPIMPPVGLSAAPSQPVFIFVPIRERIIVQREVIEKPPATLPSLPPWEDGGYVYNGTAFEADHPSYAGFLAACEEFLLSTERLDPDVCVSHDSQRRYYPTGMSWRVALFYRELLQRARIIDNEGKLFPRIRNIEDIRQRVPYFEVPRGLSS